MKTRTGIWTWAARGGFAVCALLLLAGVWSIFYELRYTSMFDVFELRDGQCRISRLMGHSLPEDWQGRTISVIKRDRAYQQLEWSGLSIQIGDPGQRIRTGSSVPVWMLLAPVATAAIGAWIIGRTSNSRVRVLLAACVASIGLFALLTGAWLSSLRLEKHGSFRILVSQGRMLIESGMVHIGWDILHGHTIPPPTGWLLEIPAPSSIWFGTRPATSTTSVPLWPLIPTCLCILGWLTWRTRYRPLEDHCPNCNYNLTGNQSGKCPECGTPTSASTGTNPNKAGVGIRGADLTDASRRSPGNRREITNQP